MGGGTRSRQGTLRLRDSFAERFTLYLDDTTTVQRLQAREPERWQEDSAELQKTLAWNAKSKQISLEEGSVVINGAQSPETIADQILTSVPESK